MTPVADTTTLTERIQAVPVLQPLYADDLVVGGLIVCGIILAAVLSDRKHFLPRLLKGFFLPRENNIEILRTANAIHMRMGMYLVAFFSAGLLLATCVSGKPSLIVGSGLLWLLATAAVTLLHLLRLLLFVMTDRIFFDPTTQKAWEHSYANWTVLSSVPLYLSAIVAVFFDLPPHTLLLLLGGCIVLLEICLFYKAFCIFSGKKHGILQLFVYLCTLELIPLLLAGKALVLFV